MRLGVLHEIFGKEFLENVGNKEDQLSSAVLCGNSFKDVARRVRRLAKED
jgi:hypothetical protein